SCRFSMGNQQSSSANWEPGPPWRVVEATETFDNKFNALDVVHSDRETRATSTGSSVFTVPIALCICLAFALLASLIVFFVRRACFPHHETHQQLPMDETKEPKEKNANSVLRSLTVPHVRNGGPCSASSCSLDHALLDRAHDSIHASR
ncbi:hypothetical protein PENTCL1PPCAC_7923, partial [Pristionchus entomophagus]